MLLHELFVRTARANRKTLFLIDRTVGRRVTYGRALIGALILARRFRRYDRGFVGIMVPTSAGCVLAILGVLLSGRVPVMINYATGAAKNALFAQKSCGFRTIVTSRALLAKLDLEPGEGMVFIEEIMEGLSVWEDLRAGLVASLPVPLLVRLTCRGCEEEAALVLFTSGSEREPKTVPLTHRNILSNVDGLTEVFSLQPDDSVLANLPLFHVLGQTASLWVAVRHGMTAVTLANPLDFRGVCRAIREERPTIVVGTPSFFRGYLLASEDGDFASVRVAVAGADRCPDALREAFLERHGVTLLEGYGTTETSPVISVNTAGHNRPGSVGRVLPGVTVRIEDLETEEECAVGETGKVLVQGDLVMGGYLGDLEATSSSMRHGWYDTGDMGYFDDDGFLWHAGRLKRFVKVGGEMVSLVFIETVLDQLLPDDVVCCVVGIPDPVKGSRIIAVVTADVDERALRRALASRLPAIAIPKEFMTIEELPETGGGKASFRAITEIVRERLAG
jgi:acyl-[acyl-carrier-protein]-phospholipid O-acyltransferase/long-chain-fatty-acid--[acyl-carrier-protein] ligase